MNNYHFSIKMKQSKYLTNLIAISESELDAMALILSMLDKAKVECITLNKTEPNSNGGVIIVEAPWPEIFKDIPVEKAFSAPKLVWGEADFYCAMVMGLPIDEDLF